MSGARLRALIVSGAIAFSLIGCSLPGIDRLGASCLVTPVAVDRLPEDPSLRARIKVFVGDETVHLDVVAERRDETLAIVGLTSYGMRLFAVEQRGEEIRVDAAAGRRTATLARWVTDALHRGHWIRPPTPSERGATLRWRWDDEEVVEASDDRGRRRTFTRARGGSASDAVSIDYPATGTGFEVRNPWCGYRALVVPLDPDAT